MPQQRDPFMWEVEDVLGGPRGLTLITEPWTGRDQVLYCEVISIVDRDNAPGVVDVGLVQGGHFVPLDTYTLIGVGLWSQVWLYFTFLSKWQIYARFTLLEQGVSLGDRVGMHVIGYVLEPYSSP